MSRKKAGLFLAVTIFSAKSIFEIKGRRMIASAGKLFKLVHGDGTHRASNAERNENLGCKREKLIYFLTA